MLHTFAKQSRIDLATDLTVITDKDLPEVVGYRVAKSPQMQAAIAEYNAREYDAALARQLSRLAK